MRFNRCGVLLLVLLVVLLPSVFALSFSSNPSISPSRNMTTNELFLCQFTPTGGSLDANITWYKDGVLWSGADDNLFVTDDSAFESITVGTANTLKSQTWVCQVTINNLTNSVSLNSSNISIVNSLPEITSIANQTVYEDTTFNLLMTAVDPDGGDTIRWSSNDLNDTDYSGVPLFSIISSGLISFMLTDESMVGNHTMQLLASDGTSKGISGIEVTFEFFAVNDAPIITLETLTAHCIEETICDHAVLATDEEHDILTFDANDSLINISSLGILNFVPTAFDVGEHLILVNVTDGVNWTEAILNLTINGTNHRPVFTYNSSLISSGVQNQSTNFTFYINATDIDATDALSFSIDSNCSLINPWSINLLTDGVGSTNASAMINLNINNNDFVVCRDVEITVSDGFLSLSENFTLNITNSNDAPTIYNNSIYSQNVISAQFTNDDMSNISAAKGLPFSFRVNATDVDTLTYEGESFIFSLFGHDPLLYRINSTTGLITSIEPFMNDSYVGNISFDVLVTDDGGLITNATVNISIINNSLPILSAINSSNCLEETLCFKEFVATDAEGDNLSLSLDLQFISFDNVSHTYGTLEAMSFLNVSFVSFVGTVTNYTMNLYSDDMHVGNYSLNVTFTDNFEAFDTQEINFSIINIDDIPYLGDNYSALRTDTLSFPITAEILPFSKILYGVDGDIYYGQENLTFNYSFISGNLANINLTKLTIDTASLTFTPNLTDSGNYSLNLTVIDSLGLFSSQIVNFTVFDSVQAPLITAIRPYLNASNATVGSFTTSLGANNISTVYALEGDTLLFDVQATDNDDLDMVVTWYFDDVLMFSNLPLGASFYEKTFGYTESGLFNITAYVTDRGLAAYTWLVNVTDINRVPLFVNNITDLTASKSAAITGTQIFADFFRLGSPDNIVFLELDDDLNSNGYIDNAENNTLVFAFNESSSCNSYADFSFNESQLTISPTTVGNCTANFYATDEYNSSVSSNTFRIDILDLGQDTQTIVSPSSGTKTVTRTITVPLDNDVASPVKFVYPGISSLYADGVVVIPYTLKNNWDADISGITLSFNSSLDELEGTLSITEIASLAPGSFVTFNLTYENYRFEAPFEVNLSADIDSLDLIDTASVFINALEKGTYSENAVKTRIGFARDLLSDNSECQELNEILTDAEKQGDVEASLALINSVINGCKYLINTQKTPTNEVPLSATGRLGVYAEDYIDYRLLVTMILGMVIAAVAIGIFGRFKLKKI